MQSYCKAAPFTAQTSMNYLEFYCSNALQTQSVCRHNLKQYSSRTLSIRTDTHKGRTLFYFPSK